MTLKIDQTELIGVKLISKSLHRDSRGHFSKTYSNELFESLGLEKYWSETFFSNSVKNVVRGMHYQKRPFDHDKLVSVIHGSILDVVVCVDPNSPEFQRSIALELDADSPYSVYISKGYAHGFLTKSDEACVLYQTTSVYNSSHDTGVHFESFGYDWPGSDLIVSDRDRMLPLLGDHDW